MNFVLYKEFLNPCRLKRLQFTSICSTSFQLKIKEAMSSYSKGTIFQQLLNVNLKRCTHYKFISVFHNFKPKTINVNGKIMFRKNSFPSLLLWSNLIFIFYLFFISFFFFWLKILKGSRPHIYSMCLSLPPTYAVRFHRELIASI